MTVFTRTTNGLKNQNRFFNVDIMIYVEGGNHIDTDNIIQNKNQPTCTNTLDTIFWENIFQTFTDKKVKVLSIGSKSNLLSLYSKLKSNNIDNIFVAVDSDFDLISNQLKKEKGIIFTWGYSWETDTMLTPDFQNIFSSISTLSKSSYSVTEIITNWKSTLNNLEKWIRMDICFTTLGKGFFDRNSPRKNILIDDKIEPNESLLQHRYENLINMFNDVELSNSLKMINTIPENQIFRYLYGHLLAEIFYHFIILSIKEISGNKFSCRKETIFSISISRFKELLQDDNNPITMHYKLEFDRNHI